MGGAQTRPVLLLPWSDSSCVAFAWKHPASFVRLSHLANLVLSTLRVIRPPQSSPSASLASPDLAAFGIGSERARSEEDTRDRDRETMSTASAPQQYNARNSFYLRISSSTVLQMLLLLDARHVHWMDDDVLERVLAALKPRIAQKLGAEQQGGSASSNSKKRRRELDSERVDVFRGGERAHLGGKGKGRGSGMSSEIGWTLTWFTNRLTLILRQKKAGWQMVRLGGEARRMHGPRPRMAHILTRRSISCAALNADRPTTSCSYPSGPFHRLFLRLMAHRTCTRPGRHVHCIYAIPYAQSGLLFSEDSTQACGAPESKQALP